MDELQKLYDVLVREGKYTKSFDEFKVKWGQDQAYKDKVFDVVSRDGLYTKDKNSFFQKYSGGGLTPQVPEQPIAQPIQPAQGVLEVKKKEEQIPFMLQQPKGQKSFLESQLGPTSWDYQSPFGQRNKTQSAPKVKESTDFLEPSLNTITAELINKNEEFVVPKMNYQFGDLGFKFEESGVTGDFMTATAPNGKTLEISLDPFFSSKAASESQKLKQFIKENAKEVKGLSTIERSYAAENKKFDTQKEVDDSIKKINDDATTLNQEMGNFLKQKSELEAQFADLSKSPQTLKNTPEYIAKSQAALQKQKDLETQRQQLLLRQGTIESQSKYLDKAVGRYTEMKSMQDAWYEVPLISLAKGVGSLASGLYGMSIDAITEFAPKEMLMGENWWKKESLRVAKDLGIGEPSAGQSEDKWLKSLSQSDQDKLESKIRDNLKKRDKYMTVGGESQDPVFIKSKYIELAKKEGIEGPKSDSKQDYYKWLNTLPESKKREFDKNISETAMGGTSVGNLIRNSLANSLPVNTPEESYKKIQEGFVGGALTGAFESIPAFLGGGGASRLIRLFAQAEDATMRDMENNPNFKDISENEKRLVSAPISIATAVLEEFGFRNVVSSKGLLNGVVGRALGKSGATTTSRTFAEFIRNDVDNMLARGTLKLVGGALAEAETGALQQASQLSVEKIYNEVKGKEMYKLPEDIGGVIADILKAGAQEAIGGLVLGMPSAVSSAYTKKGFSGMDDVTFTIFEAAANDENIQKAFVTKLKNQVNQGEITMEQAKETLNSYRNSVGLFKSMPEGLDTKAKKEAMNLLKEKKDLENQIIGKDAALVKPQKDRINAIDESLTKLSEDAIQKQAADESLLRSQQSEMGLPKVGEGDTQSQVVTTGTETQNVVTKPGEQITTQPTIVVHAPVDGFGLQYSENINESDIPRGKDFRGMLPNEQQDELDKGNSVVNENTTLDNGDKKISVLSNARDSFGRRGVAVYDFLIPSNNESTADGIKLIIEQLGKENLTTRLTPNQIINQTVSKVKEYIDSNKTTTEQVSNPLQDVSSTTTALNLASENELRDNIPLSVDYDFLNPESISQAYHQAKQNNTNPELVKAVEELVSSKTPQTTQIQENGQQTAAATAATGATATGPIAGNRLFNKPLTKAKEVANRYYQRIFGTERPKFAGTRKLDEVRAKRISDAYIAMKDDPTNPEVKAAYEALAKETLEQYKDFLESGFTVEINNEEPYANSQEMIDDLRNNNRIKIFSTESGFGSNPITEEQRQKNPLLRDSGLKDVNGKPLLVNDVFRAIHDFYGHAELGNSFGAKGEENAWNIHARMFSPLARRAMTTETRGQNSYVNFSGVNEKIEKLRDDARRLREQGDEAGAQLIVEQIYQEGLFAEQKIGLLPEEFSQFDEADAGDVTMRAQGLQERDMTEAQVGEFEAKAKKLAEDIENFQIPSWFSATLPEGTQTSGMTAEDFKKLVAKSVVEVGKLMDRGVEFATAVKEAVKDLVDQLGESNRGKIEQTVKEYFNKGEGVSETELPGYNALNSKVDAMIETQNKKKVDAAKIEKNVMKLVQQSDAYKQATDVQKEKLVREARKKLGLKEKSAPSVTRLKTEAEAETEGQSFFQKFFGAVKKDAKVTMTEKNLLKKQIKDLARGAKDAKAAFMRVSNELSKGIKELTTRGTISDTQAKNVLRKFSKVNMFSQKSVDSFIDYMTKVFANAEYASKINEANGLKKDISKFSKDKNKNANLRDMAQQFVKIDPSMVEDIDAYNEMAAKIKEAIKGSTIRGEKVTFANTVNIENASNYITKTLAAQDEKIREQKAEEIQDLMGIDVSELSYDEMMELLDSKQPITKYNEGIIRDTIQKMFDIYSSIINATIETGKDQFNDEDVEFTKNQKALIKRFMDMDLSLLKPKEALQAVDAVANFLQNHSTAKMETVLSEYTANFNAKKIIAKGIVAQPLRKYWSEKFGRFLGEQTTNLNVLFEKMFKGFNRGGEVEDAMGVTKLKNNKSIAERESNNIVDKYVSQFYKRKANGEAYNSENNSIERGLAAFMIRNVIGTVKEMQTEFNRRKDLIKESIQVLSQGNEQEQKKSELYQKVYDKILKDSNSIQDIKDNTDETNLEGIDFWNKEWAAKYEQLSDVSENIYNKVLDKDLNYTPDKFVKLSSETGIVELNNDESAFHNNNGTIYKKETGVLMTAVKPETLPTNPKSGETSMYIDLSFDKNNSNAMYDALIDMGTAAPIRQIEAFLNSPDFKKIVPKAEDAKILKDRIQLYVGNIRNKNPYSNDELSAVVRGLNKIASIGVGQALGGVLQPFKQVIPVAMNTLVNAGGLDMGAMFNAAKNGFINRTGYAIANRGIESQAQVESLNKLIDEASKSKGQALIKNIEKLNKWWLEKFLVNPDVFIARASWITYYEQSLKKQGINTKGIDYNTHEANEEAADYAQRMVDRQQNVSDADLSGKMFSNKESSNQLFVKMLMPFASFRMNQSARLGADLAVLSDKTATAEDKKIALRSLSGFAVEMVTFKMVAAGSAILLGSAAKLALGSDEDDEEYKKRVNNIIKGQVTSTFNDIVSPLPILDKAFQAGGNFLTESMLGIPKESVFSIYGVPKQDYIQSLGLFGIAADRASQLYDISRLTATGKYTDDFGKVKEISEKDRQALKYLIAPAILSNVGLAPVEANSIVRNAIKDAKKGKGKSTEDAAAKQERASEKQADTSQKLDALETLQSKTTNQDELDAIDQKIYELTASPEDKKSLEQSKKAEKEQKEYLLTDFDSGKTYDNETDLKRYNPTLYNQNFGPQSEWYQEHKAEKAIDRKLNKETRKLEDIEEGYVAPVKAKRSSKRNSDGSIKRTKN